MTWPRNVPWRVGLVDPMDHDAFSLEEGESRVVSVLSS
jgi:hypothetical protein